MARPRSATPWRGRLCPSPSSASSPTSAPAPFRRGTPEMTAPSVIDRVRAGEPIFGLIQTIPEPTLTELAVWCGYDLVVIDCEHGVIDETRQLACLQVATHAGAACGVRIRPDDFGAVGRYLDWGADAILMA